MTILRCLSLVKTSFFGSNTFCVDFLTSPWVFLENIPEAGETRMRKTQEEGARLYTAAQTQPQSELIFKLEPKKPVPPWSFINPALRVSSSPLRRQKRPGVKSIAYLFKLQTKMCSAERKQIHPPAALGLASWLAVHLENILAGRKKRLISNKLETKLFELYCKFE